MTKEVIVKRNKYGIKLILDNHIPFPELLQLITDKFKETGNFFKDAQMALSFEGRVLTPDEQLRIIETITENTSIRIACIVDDDSALEERMRTQLEAAEYAGMPQAVAAEETSTDFYKGNLRSGQVLESYSNITLIGDVNPGAKIISHGSIVILGSLKGNACAGAAGAVRGGPVPGGGYTYGADPGHRAAAAKIPCRRAAVLLSGYDRRRDGRGAWHTRGRCVSAAPARAAAVEKRIGGAVKMEKIRQAIDTRLAGQHLPETVYDALCARPARRSR